MVTLGRNQQALSTKHLRKLIRLTEPIINIKYYTTMPNLTWTFPTSPEEVDQGEETENVSGKVEEGFVETFVMRC